MWTFLDMSLGACTSVASVAHIPRNRIVGSESQHIFQLADNRVLQNGLNNAPIKCLWNSVAPHPFQHKVLVILFVLDILVKEFAYLDHQFGFFFKILGDIFSSV